MGCFTIVGLLDDAIRGRDRVYTVRTRCCNREMTRTADAIFKSNLRGSEQCSYCATGQAVKVPVPIKTSLMQPGAVVGPVTIIAEDEIVGWRLVRWSCCGKEELMRVTRLYTMRHREKQGEQPLCRACTDLARQATRGKADDQQRWAPAAAVFSPGILSAALAWPRPGVRA